MRTTLIWRWDDGNGGPGYRVIDTSRDYVVALITPNNAGECWEVSIILPKGWGAEECIQPRAFRDLEGAHALAEAHAWEHDGEEFPGSQF